MRNARLPVVFAVCCYVATANTQEPTVGSSRCPISPLVTPVRYERLHQISTTPAPDDVTHKIVTPGGMVMDTPKMVAATDVLTVVARDQAVLCFGLLTFARERHKCEFSGVARIEVGGTFLFREEDVVVRFTFLDGDQVRVQPVGANYRSQCESAAQIQPAIYTRSPSAH
jgi:hypothetical protein